MKDARMIGDRAVFVTCILAAVFLLGFTAGEQKPVPKVCPVVDGMKVMSTAATRDGEICYYSKQQTGYAVKRVKL